MGKPIRLFSPILTLSTTNAQYLNATEIALRLDPREFDVTFCHKAPVSDMRLINASHIKLKQLPPRLGSISLTYEMLWGNYDVLWYLVPGSRSLSLYWKLQKLGKRAKIVTSIEGSLAQMQAMSSVKLTKFMTLVENSETLIGITPFISESFSEKYNVPVNTIPIGVDLNRFSQKKCSTLNTDGCFKVLFVGSIQPRKQVHLVLELAKSLKSESVEFHIIGKKLNNRESSNYLRKLLEQKENYGLNNVFFHGSMPNEAIHRWMEKCDVLVLPSRLEGMPKVTMEAAATGLPCIVFSDYQTPSVINTVTGFQVSSFDELLQRLYQLMDSVELRIKMGKSAREHIKQFDWDTIKLQWEKIFHELIIKQTYKS